MATEFQDFVFFSLPCGERRIGWAKLHDDEKVTVIYFPKSEFYPVEEELQSLERIDCVRIPTEDHITGFWREYRSCPDFSDNINRRHPDFKSSYIDWKNRNRAGGWAR
jgi:hypothetical protein